MGAQYIATLIVVLPSVVLGYAAFAWGASYLATIGAIGAGLAVTWPWMTTLFRVMPGTMYALLEVSFEASKTVVERRSDHGLEMEPTFRLGAACFSGVGLGILLLVGALLLSATYGTDAARRRRILRAASVAVIVLGAAALFSPSTSFGFGLLIAGVPGALMIWKSDADTRATLRVLRETW
jgi:hypothetical protein